MSSQQRSSETEMCGVKAYEACNITDGKPCSPCQEYINLEAQVVAAKKAIDKLRLQQHKVRTKINQHHDPITRQLPSEITCAIFQSTLSQYSDFDIPDTRSWVSPRSPTRREERQLVYGLLSLGAVCRAWRIIAWSSPPLWTVVPIFLGKSRRDYAKQWISRTGDLPLTILISPSTTTTGMRDDADVRHRVHDELQVERPLIKLLRKHAARWETLDYEGPSWFMFHLCVDVDSVPKLRTLSLRLIDCKYRDVIVMLRMCDERPQLTHFSFHTGYFWSIRFDIQWDCLTNVSVTIGINECIDLLQHATQLVHCRWELTERRYGPYKEPEQLSLQIRPLTQHTALQSLWIHLPSHSQSVQVDIGPLFDCFNFPLLAQLHINLWINPSTNLPWNSLATHITRSSPPLTSVSLIGDNYDYQQLLAVLERCRSLRDLSLASSARSPSNRWGMYRYEHDFLKLLAETSMTDSDSDESPQMFLPKLQSLRFRWRDAVHDRHFWKYVPAIFGPIAKIYIGDGGRRPLNSLQVRFGRSNIIDKEYTLLLSELQRAGILLDLKDEGSGEDILANSMKHHDITTSS